MTFGLAGDFRRTEQVIASNRHLTAPTNAGAAQRAGLARALVTERAARKPAAEAAARQLIAENGGSPDALRW